MSAQLSAARGAASSAGSTLDTLSRPVADGALPPDPEQVRAATRSAQAAASRVTALSGTLGGAQERLEAAKRMARDAAALRDRAADQASERLRAASEAGIEPNRFWEDFTGAAAKVWKVAVKVATVVAIVVAVIALFVGGPLVWGILLAASLVLLADSLQRYRSGEGEAGGVACRRADTAVQSGSQQCCRTARSQTGEGSGAHPFVTQPGGCVQPAPS